MTKLSSTYFSIKNSWLNHVAIPWVDTLASFSYSAVPNDRVLIIRQDAIGDYLLFRNFLPIIVDYFKSQGKTVYVLGNDIWKDIALTIDNQVPDYWLWINRLKFTRKPVYRASKIKELQNIGFGTVVHTSWHRLPFIDSLTKVLKPELSIASAGGLLNATLAELLSANSMHHLLLQGNPAVMHEFLRNAEFTSQLTGHTDVISLHIDTTKLPSVNPPKGKYAVIMMGASLPEKQWPVANYAQVITFLIQNGYEVACTGAKSDNYLYQQVVQLLSSETKQHCLSFCGTLSLSASISLISGAKLFMGNDTGLLHAATALDIPAITVARINHFGYFIPYPESLNKKLITITAADDLPEIHIEEDWPTLHALDESYPIRKIPTSAVVTAIKEIISLQAL